MTKQNTNRKRNPRKNILDQRNHKLATTHSHHHIRNLHDLPKNQTRTTTTKHHRLPTTTRIIKEMDYDKELQKINQELAKLENKTAHQEQKQQKLNWLQKKTLQKTFNQQTRKTTKTLQQAFTKNEQKAREKTIPMIMKLTEDFTILDDTICPNCNHNQSTINNNNSTCKKCNHTYEWTPITPEKLQHYTNQQLINTYTEALQAFSKTYL